VFKKVANVRLILIITMPEDDHKKDWLNKLRTTASDMMAA